MYDNNENDDDDDNDDGDDIPAPSNYHQLCDIMKQVGPQNVAELNGEWPQEFKDRNKESLDDDDPLEIIKEILDSDEIYYFHYDNIEPLSHFLAPAHPDHYDGADAETLPEDIRAAIGHLIVPSTEPGTEYLPNFFVYCAEEYIHETAVENEAAHNGIIGARAIHALRSHLDEGSALDNNAYTITTSYSTKDGYLGLWCVHPIRDEGDQGAVKYVANMLEHYCLFTDYYQGVTALRNLRKWAQEQRDLLVEEMNRQHPEAEE